jgi:glutaredoxin-related protein
MEKMGISCERFPAIKGNPGLVGCGYSHMGVIKEAQRRGYKSVLIFEDDFEFIVDKPTFWDTMAKIELDLSGGFDVVMLGYNIQHSEPFSRNLMRVKEAQTASAYIVHANMYDRLIGLYKWAMPLLQTTGRHWEYANDQVWKTLQPGTEWYASNVRIGKQRASYSDNAENFVDYGV